MYAPAKRALTYYNLHFIFLGNVQLITFSSDKRLSQMRWQVFQILL